MVYNAMKQSLTVKEISGMDMSEDESSQSSLKEQQDQEDSFSGQFSSDHEQDEGDGSLVVPPTGELGEISTLMENYRSHQSLSLLPPSPQLKTEIDLMNVMVRHKMPLSAFGTIMEWAKKSVAEHDHNFAGASRMPWEFFLVIEWLHPIRL